jgi:hypothetical protein
MLCKVCIWSVWTEREFGRRLLLHIHNVTLNKTSFRIMKPAAGRCPKQMNDVHSLQQ